MSVQFRTDIDTTPFVLGGSTVFSRSDQVILQDAGRTVPLATRTLMAKVAASGKWVPFIDETATNGTAIPQGVYIGAEVTAAALVAGDIPDAMIIVGGSPTVIDQNQLIIEASKLLTTVITVGTTDLRTVQDHLEDVGIFTQDTIDITAYET